MGSGKLMNGTDEEKFKLSVTSSSNGTMDIMESGIGTRRKEQG